MPDLTIDAAYLQHQREWSDATFGGGKRQAGVIDHIRKELVEVEESGGDLSEWADVIILALDGATRSACEDDGTVADVLLAVTEKQARNEKRTWPDWRTQPTDRAIEHVRATDEVGEFLNLLAGTDPNGRPVIDDGSWAVTA